jgi:uncharacterized membrane protein required for colicin V production
VTISTMDIYLLVLIVSAIVLGFFWGAARSLLLLAAWLVAFLAGAYLRLTLGSYLAQQWTEYPAAFSSMAAFGIIYVGVLLAAPVVIIMTTKGSTRISANQALDDLAGAALAAFAAVLGIAGLIIVLSMFYGRPEPIVSTQGGPEWTASLYESLINSAIGSSIIERIIPLLEVVLKPLLPYEVWEVMA